MSNSMERKSQIDLESAHSCIFKCETQAGNCGHYRKLNISLEPGSWEESKAAVRWWHMSLTQQSPSMSNHSRFWRNSAWAGLGGATRSFSQWKVMLGTMEGHLPAHITNGCWKMTPSTERNGFACILYEMLFFENTGNEAGLGQIQQICEWQLVKEAVSCCKSVVRWGLVNTAGYIKYWEAGSRWQKPLISPNRAGLGCNDKYTN